MTKVDQREWIEVYHNILNQREWTELDYIRLNGPKQIEVERMGNTRLMWHNRNVTIIKTITFKYYI